MDPQTTMSVEGYMVENVKASLTKIGEFCPSEIEKRSKGKKLYQRAWLQLSGDLTEEA